jgi:hypothetical protein
MTKRPFKPGGKVTGKERDRQSFTTKLMATCGLLKTNVSPPRKDSIEPGVSQ